MIKFNNNEEFLFKIDNAPVKQNQYVDQESTLNEISAESIMFSSYRKPPKTQNGLLVFVIMLAVVALISIVSIVSIFVDIPDDETTKTTSGQITQTTRPYDENRPQLVISGVANGEGYSAVEIAERLSPSIVTVLVYHDGMLNYSGSGVIMTSDGYIITCAHIINETGALTTYRVRLSNNVEYNAQVIGYDDVTDIGVIKIEAEGLQPAEFADSAYLKSGQDIWAVGTQGNSGFSYSITDGIISSPNQYITVGNGSEYRVIQHTATVNYGYSGGALVNEYGQVVGIVSSRMSVYNYEGVGFAVSVSYAKNAIDDIIQYGIVVRRALLGISYLEFDSVSEYGDIVSENNLPPASVLIMEISEKSDLANYDVREGDLLIGVNGEKLDRIELMNDAVTSAVAGDKITLEFFRPETKETFEITCKLTSENEF